MSVMPVNAISNRAASASRNVIPFFSHSASARKTDHVEMGNE